MGCCWSEEQIPINPHQVDSSHFDVHRVVGKGGFGKVNVVKSRAHPEILYAQKTLRKSIVLADKESNIQSVWLERSVMAQFRSHFLVHLHYAFQDEHYLYLIMSFMQGGDLRYHLSAHGVMSEEECRFYAAEILLALEEMHSLQIIYRDLKPENILLDDQGHLRLSDFGLSERLGSEADGLTRGECGTPGYMAPELMAHERYGYCIDFYSYGVLLYELLHSHVPIMEDDVNLIPMNDHLSEECQDLLRSLLQVEVINRLGCAAGRAQTTWEPVKAHPWFRSISWSSASQRNLTPPFKPKPDIANCDPIFELEEQLLEDPCNDVITPEQQLTFIGWEYRVDELDHPKPDDGYYVDKTPLMAPRHRASNSIPNLGIEHIAIEMSDMNEESDLNSKDDLLIESGMKASDE